MRHLITGATGNIGSLVTQRLIDRGGRPCVFVRDAAKARSLFGDAVEVRVGDLAADQASLAASFAGADSLFLLNVGPDLAARDRVAALAARAAGVRHVVKLSTLDVLSSVGTGPWHARGEAVVRDSGIAPGGPGGFPPGLPQIRTCGIPASGSSGRRFARGDAVDRSRHRQREAFEERQEAPPRKAPVVSPCQRPTPVA